MIAVNDMCASNVMRGRRVVKVNNTYIELGRCIWYLRVVVMLFRGDQSDGKMKKVDGYTEWVA